MIGNYLLKNSKGSNLSKGYKSILGIKTNSFLCEPVIIRHFKRRLLYIEILDNLIPLQSPCLTFIFLSNITIAPSFRFNICGSIHDGFCVLKNSSEQLSDECLSSSITLSLFRNDKIIPDSLFSIYSFISNDSLLVEVNITLSDRSSIIL